MLLIEVELFAVALLIWLLVLVLVRDCSVLLVSNWMLSTSTDDEDDEDDEDDDWSVFPSAVCLSELPISLWWSLFTLLSIPSFQSSPLDSGWLVASLESMSLSSILCPTSSPSNWYKFL